MNRSRGQIILLAAFALALIFVSLALILNTAIFTENLATRETTDGHDALDLQHAVTETGDVLLRETNQEGGSYPELHETYRDRIANYSDAENVHAVSRGAIREVRVLEIHNGTFINQSDETSFKDDNDTSTWQVSANTTAVRALSFNISDAEADTPFEFNVTNKSRTWTLSITEENETFTVLIENATGATTDETVNSTHLQVQPTNGSIQGASWSELQFQDDLQGPYDLWIANGSNTTGTYQMTIDTPVADVDWTNYDSTSDPRKTKAIYNATLALNLTQSDLNYQANVTIEPDGNDPRQ